MTSKTKIISYDHRVRFFWTLVCISVLALFAYVYAIHATARNIAMRQNLEREVAKISVDLDSLEFSYIELKNDVTIELAYQYGFKEVKDPLFVSRPRPASLSLHTADR